MQNIDQLLQQAIARHRAGELDLAAELYRAILAREPSHVDARHLLGLVAHAQGNHAAAVEAIQSAIAASPRFSAYHHNLGGVYLDIGRYADAIRSFETAKQLDPAFPATHYNLATALRNIGRLEDAHAECLEALRLKPDYTEARSNLGIIFEEFGRFDESLAQFESALRSAPNFADAHLNRALLNLMLGRFTAGWDEYPWMWKASVAPGRWTFEPRDWQLARLQGLKILAYHEQGLGDTVQFAQLAASLQSLGARVWILSQPSLAELIRTAPGIEGVLRADTAAAAFDRRVPLPALPLVLRWDPDRFLATRAYLKPDAARVDYWAGRLAADRGLKIGIAWQGEPKHRRDVYRSIPLDQFAPLADLPQTTLYSLQKGFGREQLAQSPLQARIVDWTDELVDFSDTAALVSNLDLVVACDSAVAHVAAAVGSRTWLALGHVPDWRWMLGREDTPWYRSMRLFRQPARGDWGGVFKRMAETVDRELLR